jgi:hypothetical protein
MSTLRLRGHVDDKHRLVAQAPATVPPGPVEVELILPDPAGEDDAGVAWQQGVALEWAEELGDARQDIYTLSDGEPVDDAR